MVSKKRNRVLLVSYDFPPLLGGVSTCAHHLALTLARHPDLDLRVLAPRHPGWEEFDRKAPFTVVRVPAARRARLAPFAIALAALKELIFWRPNAILNLFWFPDGLATFFLARVFGCPYFIYAHGVEILESEKNLWKRCRKRLAFLKRAVFRHAGGVFAVSEFTRHLVHEQCRLPLDRIRVVNNGVDCEEFFPAEKHPTVALQFSYEGRYVFLTVTRLCDYKGCDQVIRAVRKLRREFPQVLYLIGGTGPDRERLERMVRYYGLEQHVALLGKVPSENLPALYQAADCFVLVSREDRLTPNVEGFGIVFLEAAACGKPSIAGRSGGTSDAVAHGDSGWLVDPLDTDLLAERMGNLIREPNLGVAAGARARVRAESFFRWDEVGRQLAEGMKLDVRN